MRRISAFSVFIYYYYYSTLYFYSPVLSLLNILATTAITTTFILTDIHKRRTVESPAGSKYRELSDSDIIINSKRGQRGQKVKKKYVLYTRKGCAGLPLLQARDTVLFLFFQSNTTLHTRFLNSRTCTFWSRKTYTQKKPNFLQINELCEKKV